SLRWPPAPPQAPSAQPRPRSAQRACHPPNLADRMAPSCQEAARIAQMRLARFDGPVAVVGRTAIGARRRGLDRIPIAEVALIAADLGAHVDLDERRRLPVHVGSSLHGVMTSWGRFSEFSSALTCSEASPLAACSARFTSCPAARRALT